MNISSSTWDAVHTGMKMAGDSYSSLKVSGLSIAAKTGTAQERLTEPDHATLITYAPYENPEIAMQSFCRMDTILQEIRNLEKPFIIFITVCIQETSV